MVALWVRSAARDVLHGVRFHSRRPALFASAVLVLGLCIGTAVALAGLVDRLLLRPLSLRQPDRLVQVLRPADPGGTAQEALPSTLMELLENHLSGIGVLLAVGYPSDTIVSYAPDGFQPEKVRTQVVDVAAFKTLAVRSVVGRGFESDDAQDGSDRVAVVSYEYWQRRFDGAPDVVGRRFRQRDRTVTIVGVLESAFVEIDAGSAPDIWLPHSGGSARAVVALDSGVKPQQLEFVLAPLFERFLSEQPPDRVQRARTRRLVDHLAVVDASKGLGGLRVRERFKDSLVVLAIAAGVFLLIGCGNVGLLLIAVEETRRAETAVRISLGATRGQVARKTLAETCILTAGGCLLGCGLAPLIANTLIHLSSEPHSPIRVAWEWDWRSIAAVGVFLLGVTVFSVLAPLSTASKVHANYLHSGRRHTGEDGWRRLDARDLLVGVQTALALVLLVGAGLLQFTWHNLDRFNPGFDKDRLLVVDLIWDREGERDFTDAVYYSLLEKVSSWPQVSAASISGWSYFGRNRRPVSIVPEGGEGEAADYPVSESMAVGPSFFRTAGTTLLRGREFGARDTQQSPLVAILNESAASKYFGGVEGALGRHFAMFEPSERIEVVGVVADTKLNNLREETYPVVYLPFFQTEFRGTSDTPASLEIRLRQGSSLAAADIRPLIESAAPGLSARQILLQEDLVDQTLARETLMLVVASSLCVLATLLAAFGLAGVVAQSVATRRREFGIRMALGARTGDLFGCIVGRALAPVAWGIVIGIPFSLACARTLRSVLFGIEPFDPLTISSAALVLVSVALCASLPSFNRALGVEPALAVRQE